MLYDIQNFTKRNMNKEPARITKTLETTSHMHWTRNILTNFNNINNKAMLFYCDNSPNIIYKHVYR